MNQKNQDELQKNIKDLVKEVVPERYDEFIDLFEKYQPKINFLSDYKSHKFFTLQVVSKHDIQYNEKAVRAFWFALFIAWEGYCQSRNYFVDQSSCNFDRFDNWVKQFRLFSERYFDPAAIDLPEGIPYPSAYTYAHKPPQERAVSDLVKFAFAWAILHEMRHVIHQQEGTAAISCDPAKKHHEEELCCDAFATEFILGRVEEYSQETNQDPEKVRLKRELGIYFALFAITLINCESWGSTEEHPAIQDRINAVIDQIGGLGTGRSDTVSNLAFAALSRIYPSCPGPWKDTPC